jgi:hypothetical protein
MQTKSYISAAALAAALLITPQTAQAQLLGLDVDLDVLGVNADADVDVGGDSLLDADVDIDTDHDAGLGVDADVEVGGDNLVDADVDLGTDGEADDDAATSDGNLVDVDVGLGGHGHGHNATGPNGGKLIDLNIGRSHDAVLDVDLDVLDSPAHPPRGSSLITGDIRIGALDEDTRKGALLDLIDNPHLADLDLDAVIDDRRVAIVAVLDLLGHDSLADVRAAIDLGGQGRGELLDALTDSVELGSILDRHGIDPADVLAVQIAENGATEVIVLDGLVDVSLLGDGDAHTAPTAGELATLDIDALTHDELAEIDLDLLPDGLRTTAQLHLLGSDSDDADLTPAELADIDLDLLTHEQLAELDLDLLPEAVGAAVNLELLEHGGSLPDLSVKELAAIDISILPAAGDDDGTDNTGGTGGTDTGGAGGTDTGGSGGADTGGTGNTGGAGNTGGTGGTGNSGGTPNTGGTGGTGSDDDSSTPTPSGGTGGTDTTTTGSTSGSGKDASGLGNPSPLPPGNKGSGPLLGATLPTHVDADFRIATLGCDIGVLALASGADATPQAIAGADSLELVRIDGCQRSLVDSDVDAIRAAIDGNPAISRVLDDAQIPLDQVIGATIQAETLTLFIEPSLS